MDDSDAEVIAGLRRRGGSGWQWVLAVIWGALAVAHLVAGELWSGLLTAALALCWGVGWWASPQPRLRGVTAGALLVRQGWRTRSIPRAQVQGVRPRYHRGHGVDLVLQDDAEPVRLVGTVQRPSEIDAQVGALRRWASLP